MTSYQKGEWVKMVKGLCGFCGSGTCIDDAGAKSARVKVDGDRAQQRTLRLTSLRLLEKVSLSTLATQTTHKPGDTVAVPKAEL